jgi:hypothetical protein
MLVPAMFRTAAQESWCGGHNGAAVTINLARETTTQQCVVFRGTADPHGGRVSKAHEIDRTQPT